MPVCPSSKVTENEGARDLGFRSEGTFPDPNLYSGSGGNVLTSLDNENKTNERTEG